MTTPAKSNHAVRPLKIGVVVPHIFMHGDILPHVLFAPGTLARDLVNGLTKLGHEVTLFSPGPVDVECRNVTADLSLFERELALRGDTYTDLLRKHPMTFVTLARQVQSEIIAHAYTMANRGELDIVHIYTNEEETALPFAALCHTPVVFTHHDPFNFLITHKNVFPKYKHLNWISISYAQRAGMPEGTNWVGNVYHGIDGVKFAPVKNPSRDYFAYYGRIIKQKGVHLAIAAVKKYNATAARPMTLKIAGKHYAEHAKDTYWREVIEPELGGMIEYVGFIADDFGKRNFLANAHAVLVPSLFEEPFGLVAIESLACGTPVIALNSGALPEIIKDGLTGFVIQKYIYDRVTIEKLAHKLTCVNTIDRVRCRDVFEQSFTTQKMCHDYFSIYRAVTGIR